MSKNLTLKGAAFGALVALSISAVAPASAAGLADKTFVSLAPRVGTEYTVLADQYFDLTANGSSTISGTSNKDLKFLVTDPQSKIFVDQSQVATASTSFAAANAAGSNDLASVNYTFADTTITATVDTTALASGEKLFLYGNTNATAATNLNGKVLTRATNTTATLVSDLGGANITHTITGGVAEVTAGLNSRAAILANGAIDADLFESATITTSIAGETITNGRNAAGSFVVNTETNANTSARLLRLVANTTETYSATVTAWVDDNDNGIIDATEYTSETRTVTFQKAGDVTATTTLSPVVGDKVLTATVATTPTLNGQQVIAQNPNFLNTAFTRQGDATTVYAEADKTSNGTSSASAVWDDVAKTYAVVVDLDADLADESAAATGADGDDVWATLAGANNIAGTDGAVASAADKIVSIAVAATNVVTVTTYSNHNLRAGDKVTVVIDSEDSGISGAAESTAVSVTVTGDKTFTYKASETTALTAATDSQPEEETVITVATYATDHFSVADRVFAGTYTAQAVIETTSETTWTAIGAKASVDTASATSKSMSISTVGSASVQGKTFTAVGTNTTKVKTGTKSVDVTIAVTDVDGVAVSAGRTVVVSLSASGTADTFKVNGKSTSATVATDAAGKVTVTITAANGFSGAALQVTALAENIATADIDLAWEDAAIGIVDLSGTAGSLAGNQSVTRTILKGGSYTLDLGVSDQFNTAADSAAYRFKVYGNGVTEAIKPLTAGKASVVVTDTLNSTLTTYVVLQKLTSGVWGDSATWTITSNVLSSPAVVLGASGSTTYGNAVVTSAAVAAKALVEIDKRSSSTVTPAYANNLVLNGAAVNSLTSVGTQGAVVTVSGASNILFENGEVSKLGSLTFVSGASGLFEVKAYSTTAQTDSVITFTSNGKTATIKVSFTGVSTDVKKLSITPNAATYIPGQTVLYTVKLTDNLGNPVNTTAPAATPAAAYITVSYAGPGIISQTLPVETDASGEAQVRIVTGVVDTQAAVLTVKYDQNYDGDFVDTYDLTATSTVYAVGTAPSSSVAAASGSTGKFYVSATNAANRTVVVKVAGKFVKSFVPGSASKKVVAIVASAGNKAVTVFVGGKLALTKTVTVK